MGTCVSIHIDGETMERSRLAKEALSADEKARERLACIQGRMCSNGASRTSSLFSKQGQKGVNQDCMLVWEGFADESTVLCAVFDGHGPRGHQVACRVRDELPTLLVDNSDIMAAQADWEKKLVAACIKMDEQLKDHPYINCACSGTTMLTAIIQGMDIVIGNVGDSRAIIGKQGGDGSNWIAEQLTIDLKPNVPEELERIRRCRGQVFALADEPHVYRMWLPSGKAPGLAIARALGDFRFKDYGLIALPQVVHRRFMQDDKFLVLATDGVWDALSNEEVVEIIASSYSCKQDAAKKVVDVAVKQWKLRKPNIPIDDCAVVCYFFEGNLMSLPHVNRHHYRNLMRMMPD